MISLASSLSSSGSIVTEPFTLFFFEMHATMLCNFQIFRKFFLMHPADCFGTAMGLLSQQPHLIQGLAKSGYSLEILPEFRKPTRYIYATTAASFTSETKPKLTQIPTRETGTKQKLTPMPTSRNTTKRNRNGRNLFMSSQRGLSDCN